MLIWDSHAFSTLVREFLRGIDDPSLKRLFLLAALGDFGSFGREWLLSFRELGVLHLLVLSGSQIQFLGHFVRGLAAKGLGVLGFRAQHLALCGLVIVAVFVYCASTAWQAPLVRAAILTTWALVIPRLRTLSLCVLSLLAQVLLFPSHVFQLGFYLSWMAYLILKICAQAGKGRVWASLIVTILCQFAMIWMKGLEMMPLRSWFVAVSANWVLGSLFEGLVMPLCGLVGALAFFLSPFLGAGFGVLGVCGMFAQVLAPIFDGTGGLILVVREAFMYIR